MLVAGLGGASLLALARARASGIPALDRARALVPLALFPPLYGLSGRINVGLDRWILDGPLERLEGAIFGGQPSLFLAQAMPWPALSEVLHACYFAYFLLVPMPAILLAVRGHERNLRRVVAWLTGCFLFCQIFYVWLPATSPLYAYPPLPPPLDRGVFYGLTHAAARAGGVVGGAFPSSHAALGTLALLLAWRYERRWFTIALLPTAGMLLATVYGRWHFALDTIAGIAIALAFAAIERWAAAVPPRGPRRWPAA